MRAGLLPHTRAATGFCKAATGFILYSDETPKSTCPGTDIYAADCRLRGASAFAYAHPNTPASPRCLIHSPGGHTVTGSGEHALPNA
jgi:hypothetical protein